jgi:hypothetical protein
MNQEEAMWTLIGNFANVLQILSVIPLLFTAGLMLTRARRYRKLIRQWEQTVTPRPAALAIGLAGGGMDISGQVKQFLEAKGLKMDVRSYTASGVTRENISRLLRDVLRIKAEMTAEGVTEVHLFLSCPVVFAAAVGALLDNWVPVKLYHNNREGNPPGYEFWTPLYKGTVPGLETTTASELVEQDLT